jgi:hypothetical protein
MADESAFLAWRLQSKNNLCWVVLKNTVFWEGGEYSLRHLSPQVDSRA